MIRQRFNSTHPETVEGEFCKDQRFKNKQHCHRMQRQLLIRKAEIQMTIFRVLSFFLKDFLVKFVRFDRGIRTPGTLFNVPRAVPLSDRVLFRSEESIKYNIPVIARLAY